VVAYAGIELLGKATVDVTDEEFDRLFAVNTIGTFFTLQQAAAKRLEDNGRIIFIGSSTGEFPMPGHALYGASKMARASRWRFWQRNSTVEASRQLDPSFRCGERRR